MAWPRKPGYSVHLFECNNLVKGSSGETSLLLVTLARSLAGDECQVCARMRSEVSSLCMHKYYLHGKYKS